MYRVESKRLSHLFTIWRQDMDEEEEEKVGDEAPLCSSVTLSDSVGLLSYFDPEEADVPPPPELIDAIVQHYLNEYAPNERLVALSVSDDAARFVWLKS